MSRRPTLAAVMPLPTEEVTPPVTKMYFGMGRVLRGFFQCYRIGPRRNPIRVRIDRAAARIVNVGRREWPAHAGVAVVSPGPAASTASTVGLVEAAVDEEPVQPGVEPVRVTKPGQVPPGSARARSGPHRARSSPSRRIRSRGRRPVRMPTS